MLNKIKEVTNIKRISPYKNLTFFKINRFIYKHYKVKTKQKSVDFIQNGPLINLNSISFGHIEFDFKNFHLKKRV